jgi:hypothetical protein
VTDFNQKISIEDQGQLRMRGYQVVVTCRDDDGYVVEYPQKRPRSEAHLGHFSLEIFSTQDAAWVAASADYAGRPVPA